MDNNVSTAYGDIEIPTENGQGSTDSQPTQPPAQTSEPQSPWWEQHLNSEMEFQAAGKHVKAPLSQVRQWAQQGYHYAQNLAQFNAQRAEFEAKQAEFSKDAEWGEIAKFARENPEWAEHTKSAWEQRQNWQQGAQSDPNIAPFLQKISSLEQKLSSLEPTVKEFQSERTRLQQEAEDKALDAEIQGVHDRYSKIGMDLDKIDPETGMSYKMSVLKYGSENGIQGKNAFKIAFQALYGDKIEGLMQEAAKKQAADDFAKRQKEGFIGRTSTPTQAPSKAQNVRNRSWGSLSDEALRDIQSGKY